MRTHLLYIIGVTVALLSSCHDDFSADAYLNGSEKTPLTASALIDGAGGVRSRAVNKDFEASDQLVAYLRHVTWNGTTAGARTSVEADHAPQLVTFTKGSAAMAPYDGTEITPIGTGVALGLTSGNTQQTADLTASPAIYWDDFSSSADADHDLRTAGHYLQSFYGYCYNGGTPSTALDEATGALGWTVSADQHEGFKTSDLLWSAEQTPVAYAHVDAEGNKNHGTLLLPYTHAMSKVTIEVVCKDGFNASAADNFGTAAVTLKQMSTVSALTAPAAQISAGTTLADVQMLKDATPQDKQCSFSALVAPTLLKEGLEFATLTGFDGNNYKLVLTDAVIDEKTGEPATTKPDAWSTQLVASGATSIIPSTPAAYTAAEGGIMRPGVNYLIRVTLNKQSISVNAVIRDWDAVSAEGVGTIQFAGDVTEKTGAIATELQAKGFDLYKAPEAASPAYGKAATTYSYVDTDADGTADAWTRTNEIYWPNATDKYYFRALSGATADDPATMGTNESLTMANGRDVLWGTTSKDAANGYNEGAAIAPRTGDVPLTYYHPMAKITVNLVDENKNAALPDGVLATDYANPLNPRIDLTSAKVQITNMATGGIIDLHTGDITPATVSATMLGTDTGFNPYLLNSTANIATSDLLHDYIVTPQTIGNDVMLIVTLADGTTYKTQLNTCTVTATATADLHPVDAVINKWNRGVSYTYTITLSKEKITFRALIENWDEVKGGGKGTLDWD